MDKKSRIVVEPNYRKAFFATVVAAMEISTKAEMSPIDKADFARAWLAVMWAADHILMQYAQDEYLSLISVLEDTEKNGGSAHD